ncbi:Hypothetical predicted protein [Paramuricea clavata]|uniref:Uncharacterized protein n=1 Tax=Paramuricea clavata TaxID=317549 RepID=A0A7D9D9L8_PARCT|nr:Hypothetical predicted protein [Paramuricea clavata]
MESATHRWEKIVGQWMSNKTFMFEEDERKLSDAIKDSWDIKDLVNLLLKQELIPDFVCDNVCLYNVLMLQMERLMIGNLTVPMAVQGINFTYTLNCKEMKMHVVCRDLQKAKDELEKLTGVNLDHYYRLKMAKKKRKINVEAGNVKKKKTVAMVPDVKGDKGDGVKDNTKNLFRSCDVDMTDDTKRQGFF